jgi:mitogen-activated protein kinase 15
MKCHEDFEEEFLDRYEILERLGRGRCGLVNKGYDKLKNSTVAVKRLFEILLSNNESERVYKEIRILEHFQGHPNIISLQNVFKSRNDKDVILVYEYMEANLFHVIRGNILSEIHVKFIAYQLLKALKYIHSADVVHRNLKPSGVLINSDCKIKIDDFYFAKPIKFDDDNFNDITDYVSTRWYRAPEILLGANFNKPADIWSVGCIIGEMLNGRTVFPGTCTLNQLNLIVQLCGKPSEEDVKDIEGSLSSLLGNIKPINFKNWNNIFLTASEEAVDLLQKMLMFNPKKRITVDEALGHYFFKDVRNVEEEINCGKKLELEISDEMKKEILEYRDKNFKENGDTDDVKFITLSSTIK